MFSVMNLFVSVAAFIVAPLDEGHLRVGVEKETGGDLPTTARLLDLAGSESSRYNFPVSNCLAMHRQGCCKPVQAQSFL